MILIVDDKRENILPLKKILALHNLESDEAYSGEEALKKTLQKNYSLIILDVQMPGMDGFEVGEALAGSNRTKDIPIIFLSAINKEKKYITKGYQSGGVDYITKPVDPELFILRVKTFLQLYQQQNELKDTRDLLVKEIKIRKEAQENLEVKVVERTAELQQKNEELEQSNHELQQFSWVVSHDLKEPLRKIEIFVKLLGERCLNEEPKGPFYVQRTILATERMSDLIHDLLSFSRLSSELTLESFDLNHVINEVATDLENIFEEKKGILLIEGKLPEITGVRSQFRQVFQNLISNSLKFVEDNTPPKITISADYTDTLDFDAPTSSNGKFHRIVVSDNGIGFEEQYKEKIFTIFQRLHNRDTYEGTGIGLAIAKKIIEKHKGLIMGQSKAGEGATFIMILPILSNQDL
ncbi:MAG: response regulator [Bacteroidota bacterium]